MRILFLAPQPFFRERGTPIRALRQLEELSRLGHQVDVVCYPLGRDIDLPGVTVLRVWGHPGIRDIRVGPSLAKLPLDSLLFWRALRMCLRRRYDVIQAVEEAAFFAVWLKRIFRCRLIYNMDSHISDQLRYTGFVKSRWLLKLAAAMERGAMRHSEFVVTVGPVLSDVVRSAAPRAGVLQLEDAPPQEHFEEDPEGALRLRRELGLGDAPVALYTGNFRCYQGVDLLVRSAREVAARMPSARIVLAGGAENEIAEMRRLGGQMAADGVCVFAGQRPESEMPAFLTMAYVLVSPRTQGTNPPLKIYPYMQSGRVIVATRLSTHTQVLDDSCAILTAPTPPDLAAGIVRAFTDIDAGVRLSREARARVAGRYSLAAFQAKVRGMYEKLEAAAR
jgi:glycosyltransferase involved in cell wall biosynthesis